MWLEQMDAEILLKYVLSFIKRQGAVAKFCHFLSIAEFNFHVAQGNRHGCRSP